MNVKAFFVDALTSALDLKIGTPDDLLKHVTPTVLADNLPRPLWARLFTACLGAPRVDAQLVVETIGIANLCEHVPAKIIYTCIAEIAARSLGKGVLPPPPEIQGAPATIPPPISDGAPATAAAAASPPIQDVISELESNSTSASVRQRSATAQRFRQSSTGISRGGIGGNSRRPQAAATPPPTHLPRPSGRRGTEVSSEPEQPTSVETGDWSSREIAVDDSQLVDWQTDVGSASAITGDDDFSDLGNRKR